MMRTRFDAMVCGVCGCLECGYGIVGKSRHDKTLWVCEDPECLKIAKATYLMRQDEFSKIERLAVDEGGLLGGRYLEQIGKFDLSSLEPDEYKEFLERVISGYRRSLKALSDTEVPF